MRVVRKNCFETNSSSTHSLVITKNLYGTLSEPEYDEYNCKYNNKIELKQSDKVIYEFDSIKKNIKDNVLTLKGGHYGRDEMQFAVESYDKLNYLAEFIIDLDEDGYYGIYVNYYKELLYNIVKKAFPDLKRINFIKNNFNCIDHDGVDLAYTIFNSDNITLKDFGVFSLYEFIFNTSYIFLYGEHYSDEDNNIKQDKDGKIILTASMACHIFCDMKYNENSIKKKFKDLSAVFRDNIKLYIDYVSPEEKIKELTIDQN